MRLSISAKPARAAALTAVAARLFLGLTVDMPTTQNGAWLSALLGGLLALPWAFCIVRYRPRRGLLTAPLALLTLIDSAAVLAALTRSAGYLALDRSPALALLIPAGLAALFSVWRNGDAVGDGATAWTRIFPALLVVVVLLQWRYYRPAWLAPLLGSGSASIAEGSVRCAGWIVAAASVLLLADDDSAAACAPVLFGSLLAAGLIALRLMLTPTPLDAGGWLNRLDAVLCNGRTPLYLQLPMIALWFAGLLHLLACEALTVATLLQRMLPRLSGLLCGCVAAVAAMALSQWSALADFSEAAAEFAYAAIGLATIAAMIAGNGKGGRKACASKG